MKHLFILFACIVGVFFSVNVNAQSKNSAKSKVTKINTPLVIRGNKPLALDEFGQTYNSFEMATLPFHDVNSIANMVVGVNSYGGGVPNIKGAPASGTAYFIDGIRVRGTLPSLR